MDKDDVDTFISKIYYDPEKGLMGVDKLYKKLKKLNKKVTLKQVKNWLKNQATYQIHYSKHKKIKFLPIFSHKSGSYQMDLTEMPRIAGKNKGYRYILTAIQINRVEEDKDVTAHSFL